uniref:Uncharacterized protein n=1 Tax=Anguilla anguilla TaxID=7936 RepID=A0A0E9QGU6_ANGAN
MLNGNIFVAHLCACHNVCKLR